MKFLVEDAAHLDASVEEELHESSGLKVKNYYIQGIFSTPDKKNRNGRIYPSKIWEEQVARYQNEIKNVTVNSFGENEHPARTNVDKMKAVMRIVELKMEDGVVKGKAKILNNNSPETNQIKALIDEGMKIGVSSRGVGSVKGGLVEKFQLITYDIVTDPSDYNANLSGITESLNESIGEKDFEVHEGHIKEIKICKDNVCTTFTAEQIKEATKQKFDEMLESFKLNEFDVSKSTEAANEVFDSIKSKVNVVKTSNNAMTIKAKNGVLGHLVFDDTFKK